jgi:hypothetical protein
MPRYYHGNGRYTARSSVGRVGEVLSSRGSRSECQRRVDGLREPNRFALVPASLMAAAAVQQLVPRASNVVGWPPGCSMKP